MITNKEAFRLTFWILGVNIDTSFKISMLQATRQHNFAV